MARQILPRLELLTTKDKSTSDKAQVFVSATIQFYRLGATVSAPATVPAIRPPQPRGLAEDWRLVLCQLPGGRSRAWTSRQVGCSA
jgi:hypothetical protein